MVELIPLIKDWSITFHKNPRSLKWYLINKKVSREIGRSVYQYFVNSHQLEPIESLHTADKARIWNTAKGWAALEKKELISLAKTIYLFENLLQRQIQ